MELRERESLFVSCHLGGGRKAHVVLLVVLFSFILCRVIVARLGVLPAPKIRALFGWQLRFAEWRVMKYFNVQCLPMQALITMEYDILETCREAGFG
jgi:hypothetical protein